MRSRLTVVCGFLLFSAMAATPAQAGPWSSFVAWLSDLDPKSGGLGVEMRLFCPPVDGSTSGFACARPSSDSSTKHTFQIKSSVAFLFGKLDDDRYILVTPILGIVEKSVSNTLTVGAGAGLIHVGGTLVGGVTNPLIQLGRATVDIPISGWAFRTEVNMIPGGFPAGAFAPDSSATGTEFVIGLSFVYSR